MIALLFDMNKLWEEYIYRMLAKLQTDDLKVQFQNRQHFWETKLIKPDIIVEKHYYNALGKKVIENYVIDTKWKLIDPKKPGDDDLKQMYAYNMYWNAKRSMLLYPNSKRIKENFGSFWKGREDPKKNQCKVAFVNVLNQNNQLNLEIGNSIIDKLFYLKLMHIMY